MNSDSVWIICQYAGSPFHGMNYRPYYLAKELVSKGIDVTIFSGSFSHQYYNIPETSGKYTIENIEGIRYCWIKTPEYPESRSYGRVWSWWVFARALYGIKGLNIGPPDSIIVSSPSPYPIVPARSLARRYSAQLIFEVRDIWPLSLVELGNISTKHPFIKLTQWVEDFAYRAADRVVSLLPGAAGHMRSRGMDSGKFVFIPNGVPNEASTDNSVAISEEELPDIRTALDNRQFIIGYAGTFGLANSLNTFIEAAALLKDRKDIGFVMIGSGAELDKLETLTAELSLDNLVFFPPVSKDNIPAVLSQLDACYLGLKNEPLFKYGVSPTKLFDYMRAGKPVIMAIETCNDIVSESGCGFTLSAEDPEMLAEKISELADTPRKIRDRMGEAGKEYIDKNHRWRILAKKYSVLLGIEK